MHVRELRGGLPRATRAWSQSQLRAAGFSHFFVRRLYDEPSQGFVAGLIMIAASSAPCFFASVTNPARMNDLTAVEWASCFFATRLMTNATRSPSDVVRELLVTVDRPEYRPSHRGELGQSLTRERTRRGRCRMRSPHQACAFLICLASPDDRLEASSTNRNRRS